MVDPEGGVLLATSSGLEIVSDGGVAATLVAQPATDVALGPSGILFVWSWPDLIILDGGLRLSADGDPGYVDAAGSSASFSYSAPHIAVDPSSNVYIADNGNNVIRVVSPSGDVTTLAGDGPDCFLDGGPGSGEFEGPSGVAVDDAGNVYVADTGHARIAVIRPQ